MSSLFHSFKWSFVSELSSKLVTPVVFIVLARLLTPEDFGVMASALMVISFSQIFWEAGMGKALIQRQTDRMLSANFAFYINVFLGLLVALSLYLFSEHIANTIFNDFRVFSVLQVMSIQVILGSLSSVHIALMQKDMEFKKLFWVRFATISLPGLVSIPLALNGMGYWSLVIGTLIGQFAQVIVLWKISDWRPCLDFNMSVSKEIATFGAWAAASGILTWFYVWVDSLIVGTYLGSSELGIFRTGSQVPIMIFALIFAPIIPVLYSHLSKMKQDANRVSAIFLNIVKTVILIAIPVSILIFAYSLEIQIVIFGDQWIGLGFVIGVMALMHGYSWIVGLNGEVYRSMGKPSYETVVTGSTLIIYIIGYVISIQNSFDSFVWTRLVLALCAIFLHLLVLKKIIHIDIMEIIGYIAKVSIISTLIVLPSYLLVDAYIDSSVIKLFLGGVFSGLLLIGMLYLTERNGIIIVIKRFFTKLENNA